MCSSGASSRSETPRQNVSHQHQDRSYAEERTERCLLQHPPAKSRPEDDQTTSEIEDSDVGHTLLGGGEFDNQAVKDDKQRGREKPDRKEDPAVQKAPRGCHCLRST